MISIATHPEHSYRSSNQKFEDIIFVSSTSCYCRHHFSIFIGPSLDKTRHHYLSFFFLVFRIWVLSNRICLLWDTTHTSEFKKRGWKCIYSWQLGQPHAGPWAEPLPEQELQEQPALCVFVWEQAGQPHAAPWVLGCVREQAGQLHAAPWVPRQLSQEQDWLCPFTAAANLEVDDVAWVANAALVVCLTAGENADASCELKKTPKLKRETIAAIDFVNIFVFLVVTI